MKSFLEEYGFAILAAIVVILLITMATPIGSNIKQQVSNIVRSLSKDTVYKLQSSDDVNVILTNTPSLTINSKSSTDKFDYIIHYKENGDDKQSGKIRYNGTFIPNVNCDKNSEMYVEVIDKGTDNIYYSNVIIVPENGFNIDMSEHYVTMTAGQIFNSKIPDATRSIIFTNEVAPENVQLTDLSSVNDMSVVGWLDGSVWKVSSQDLTKKILFPIDCSEMFNSHNKSFRLQNIVFNNIDTSNSTSFVRMFYCCKELVNLDLSSFNTGNVRSMYDMFSECHKLENLDLSNFDTRNVKNMNWMFNCCKSLKRLDLSHFSAEKLETMHRMFNECYNIEYIDISNMKTDKVRHMGYVFGNCRKLTTLKYNNFNASSAESTDHMFYNCYVLNELDLSNWNFKSNVDITEMFTSCPSSIKIKLKLDVLEKFKTAFPEFKDSFIGV